MLFASNTLRKLATVNRPARRISRHEVLVVAVVGALGGLLESYVRSSSLVIGGLFGAAFGAFFALVFFRQATSAGAGLIWGLGSSFLFWLLKAGGFFGAAISSRSGSILRDARGEFPALIGFVVCLGLPVGLALGILGSRRTVKRGAFSWARAIVAGGLAGGFGGFLFGKWVSSGDYFPLLAGFGEIASRHASVSLHLAIAVIIGVTFGVLFQTEVHGYGSCMGWGLGYGILWWFLGPLSLWPVVSGVRVDWSAEQASVVFGSLVGHILYGLILGVAYATMDRAWVRLFILSDPINREADGPTFFVLRSFAWGGVAGFCGGLVSMPMMAATGVLPKIAGVDTNFIGFRGVAVHLLVSTVLGMTYGLLFRERRSGSLGFSAAWGWLFGMIWWYLGPLTLLPLLLTGVCDWSTDAVNALLPSMLGHLVYGAVTGVIFLWFDRVNQQKLLTDPRLQWRSAAVMPDAGTPAPALWFFALGLGVLLPILLG